MCSKGYNVTLDFVLTKISFTNFSTSSVFVKASDIQDIILSCVAALRFEL